MIKSILQNTNQMLDTFMQQAVMPDIQKRKILISPKKKSARELLQSITKEKYFCVIKNRNEVFIYIEKIGVEMSLGPK